MRRRQVVAALGLLAAGSAGCSNTRRPTPSPPTGTPPPETETVGLTAFPELEVAEFSARAGDEGNLVVDVTVSNPARRVREGSVRVTAAVGDGQRSATQTFELGPGEEREVAVTVPLSYTEWDGGDGQLDFTFEYD
ncbi:hypothetical protein [Halorientalis litorea]|uniref:hypothetical protein n=1 Tax=Halorientalis litorea TaxID=2931977 RepID=UPI001FF14C5F|nr:hypothetical protein [Halorientalis litorea]